jgi:hypothetical protein
MSNFQHPTDQDTALLPVKDPTLAEVMELLHRMALCQSTEPFTWMARDAIEKLRAYVMTQPH